MPSPMPHLTLDKASHTYTVDGVVKPCVSDIMRPLSDAYYKNAVKYNRMETARNRGVMVHEAIDFYINFGIYAEEAVEWVLIFAQWMVDEGVEIVRNELSLTDGNYCGTIDLLVRKDGKLLLVDIKTTSVINTALLEVQLAGYERLLQANGYVIDGAYVLQLKPPKGYVYQPVSINRAKWKELYEKQPNEIHFDTQGSEEDCL